MRPNKNAIDVLDTITLFTVNFYKGDDEIIKYEIKVYKLGDDVFADKIGPHYYYGTKTDSVWTVKLTKEKKKLCENFIKKAKSLPKECPQIGSVLEYYIIVLPHDTIMIDGDCDWNKVGFYNLSNKLFAENFRELSNKRMQLEQELNSKIYGKWCVLNLHSEQKRGDIIILSRVNDSKCNWEFGHNFLFRSYCNDIFDMSKSEDYLWNIDQGKIYLIIQGGFNKDQNGDISVANYGAEFIVENIDKNYIQLKFLGR
ncbi:MAG: hypothetical protein IPO85_16265 [Saprospiraceae bacterium]|uniref:Uncharacterized protein n=1 Tax=Candidatus Defluviibacterium haderslevense TaxID=2981993 RepID=A0A9D7SC11_9BACT|nr:hypothetical protein [Candidatus Defluviibacterium haderslevense]